ncbi:c-type cytochrome [Alcaligenaceae bacterium LF4-65]|uniref:C-type cytochrome n=1 Tax=Zwartia hollandica TaxID=324606 RepID=A0A953T159_9BURK|nr:c-type cytochrome [Zwartia hollandica]MBZ1349908.1 c-type cytochrome [Zwartia hollandica]
MYKLAKRLTGIVTLTLLSGLVHAQDTKKFPGIGRTATPAEVAAWDIDVRPDFKGIPKGSGTAEQGQELWEAKCANCHGVFGESNEVFTPIVGGTTAKDIKTGRVASLTDPNQPQRSTLMRVSTLSSLYDYIYRAMPWNAPRTLSADDTYALVAYILALGEIVPEDFTLSDKNMNDVQARMPNRNGTTTQHGMWAIEGKPDVQGDACMSNCLPDGKITSSLPDFARNAHENIAEQNRSFGPFRGADSTKPPLKSLPGAGFITPVAAVTAPASASPSTTSAPANGATLQAAFQKHNCTACHAPAAKGVGPSIAEVAKKYKDQDVVAKLASKVKLGGAGAWGAIPMPPHPQLPDAEITSLVTWMLKTP